MLEWSENKSYTCGVLENLNIFKEEPRTPQIKWGENRTLPYDIESAGNKTYRVSDYDEGATPLYKTIENKNWSKACSILKDKTINVEQADTWVSRREEEDETKIRWKMTVLHAAIVFSAPVNVIQSLLVVSPRLASCKNDQGMLPLHLAFRNCSSDQIIYELLVAYPMGSSVKDHKGRTAIQVGIAHNPDNYHLKVIGTHTAMMKAHNRSTNKATSKINRVKKLHDLEVEHLTLEHDNTINEYNAKLIECEKKNLTKDETISKLKSQLKEGCDALEALKDDLKKLYDDKSLMDVELKSLENDVVQISIEKKDLSRENSTLLLQVRELEAKIEGLEEELTDWRNSIFGGTLKSIFDCECK